MFSPKLCTGDWKYAILTRENSASHAFAHAVYLRKTVFSP